MSSAATLKWQNFTVANGATEASTPVNVTKGLSGSITCPASIGAATTMKFQHSLTENGTYTYITTSGSNADYEITLGASKTIPLDTSLFVGVGWIKPVLDQDPTADVTFTLNYKEAS